MHHCFFTCLSQESYIILCEYVGCCFNTDTEKSMVEHHNLFPEHRVNKNNEDVFVLPKAGIYGDIKSAEASQCPQCLKTFSSAISLNHHKTACRGRGVIK